MVIGHVDISEERKKILIEMLDNHLDFLAQLCSNNDEEDHGAESDLTTCKKWFLELTGKVWRPNG